jgi:hydrogenase nickel incorporation protein HypA/HybF
MHEFGIAQGIVEAVRVEASRLQPGNRITKIGVRIGDLAGVDVDALTFSFAAIVSGSDWDAVHLDVERLPHTRTCRSCASRFDVDVSSFDASCPGCGDKHTDFAGGDELEIAYLEVEDE